MKAKIEIGGRTEDEWWDYYNQNYICSSDSFRALMTDAFWRVQKLEEKLICLEKENAELRDDLIYAGVQLEQSKQE